MTYTPPYAWPCAVHSISDSFAAHVGRGSVNPGTDYMAAWGSPVYSVTDGFVADVVTTNYGSGGRMVYVDHDDGTGSDYLHLSQILVRPGQRVFRGDHIATSGASGYSEEFYYGAHLHISIRNRHGSHAMNAGNFDFDATIKAQLDTAAAAGGGATPIQEEVMAGAVLVRDPSGAINLCADDGSVTPVASMDEVAALLATGAVRPGPNGASWIQTGDGLIMNLRNSIAARKRDVDRN